MSTLRDSKADDLAMNLYLSSLNGKRFQNITDTDGKEIDMNIVVASMPESEIKKILSLSGSTHDTCDKCIVNDFGVFLNGVRISKTYLSKGHPIGYDNPKFKFWRIMNKE